MRGFLYALALGLKECFIHVHQTAVEVVSSLSLKVCTVEVLGSYSLNGCSSLTTAWGSFLKEQILAQKFRFSVAEMRLRDLISK